MQDQATMAGGLLVRFESYFRWCRRRVSVLVHLHRSGVFGGAFCARETVSCLV